MTRQRITHCCPSSVNRDADASARQPVHRTTLPYEGHGDRHRSIGICILRRRNLSLFFCSLLLLWWFFDWLNLDRRSYLLFRLFKRTHYHLLEFTDTFRKLILCFTSSFHLLPNALPMSDSLNIGFLCFFQTFSRRGQCRDGSCLRCFGCSEFFRGGSRCSLLLLDDSRFFFQLLGHNFECLVEFLLHRGQSRGFELRPTARFSLACQLERLQESAAYAIFFTKR
mmetsp:Transcript_61965/g.98182  ORF Transcript_61965/g.98182 Transcript_61965/m.98182 type:complete len:225 (-) Transcript_61965:604-1278(-)